MIWKLKSIDLVLNRPILMGILNLTPDSFSDGGKFFNPELAVQHALELVQQGADILDLGAESTRPGAEWISEDEELSRLAPVLELLTGQIPIPISIDTTKATVAKFALERGAQIVNDVSGLKSDAGMANVLNEFGAGVVLMHRRGAAHTMQQHTQYEDVVDEVSHELYQSIEIARASHVEDCQIVVDPGIGFSKTAEQSLELVGRLEEFKHLGFPILVGLSRKSFIGHVTGQGAQNRLNGTVASCVLAYARGAKIFRVHDVKEVKEALLVSEAILHKVVVGGLTG